MASYPKFAVSLFAAGLILGVFCWWGMFTNGGQAAFPEMAGMIPFYLGIAGAVCVGLSGFVALVFYWRRRRKRAGRAEQSF